MTQQSSRRIFSLRVSPSEFFLHKIRSSVFASDNSGLCFSSFRRCGLRYNFHFRRRWRRQRRQRRRRRRCRIFVSRRRVDSKKGTSVFFNVDEQVRCRHVSRKSCLSADVEAELGFEPAVDEFETRLTTMEYYGCQVSLL